MNVALESTHASSDSVATRLADTRAAFDSVADAYDGPVGNNRLVQRMRERLWMRVASLALPGSRLLDLGCGTGLDAAHFARLGYDVVATDWSPAMVARTRRRVAEERLGQWVTVAELGLQELKLLDEGPFDGLYSNLGPFNCAPDLRTLAADCRSLLRPGGYLVASVMGRFCPWEWLVYLPRGQTGRARIRFRQGQVPVPLNGRTVWTRYVSPGELVREFQGQLRVVGWTGLNVFVPPPYLVGLWSRHPWLFGVLGKMEDALSAIPPFRSAGDHFLITFQRRD